MTRTYINPAAASATLLVNSRLTADCKEIQMSYLRIKTRTPTPRHFTLRFNNRRWHVLNTLTWNVVEAFLDKRAAEQWAQRHTT